MQGRQKQLLESLERVMDFLRAHVPPGVTRAYAAKTEELSALVAKLQSLLSDQLTGRNASRDDVQRTKMARTHLRERHLRPVNLIARGMLALEPKELKTLAMPEFDLNNARFLAAATSFRDAAKQYEQLLVENGRPEDFLAQLDRAIEAFRDSLFTRDANLGVQVGARAGLKQQLKRARRLIQVIDALVLDAFAGDEEVLARWRTAKRVRALGGGPRPAGGTVEDTSPPQDEPKAA